MPSQPENTRIDKSPLSLIWCRSYGDGELGIALHCGQLANHGKSIRIYAGCGLVAGSDPERECAESRAKLPPMRMALVESKLTYIL